MGIRDLFQVIADGGARLHRECRECGRNLQAGVDRCPECDGDAIQYEVQ